MSKHVKSEEIWREWVFRSKTVAVITSIAWIVFFAIFMLIPQITSWVASFYIEHIYTFFRWIAYALLDGAQNAERAYSSLDGIIVSATIALIIAIGISVVYLIVLGMGAKQQQPKAPGPRR